MYVFERWVDGDVLARAKRNGRGPEMLVWVAKGVVEALPLIPPGVDKERLFQDLMTRPYRSLGQRIEVCRALQACKGMITCEDETYSDLDFACVLVGYGLTSRLALDCLVLVKVWKDGLPCRY